MKQNFLPPNEEDDLHEQLYTKKKNRKSKNT